VDILLSVLDQSPIRTGGTAAEALAETIELARCCDGWGYHRYWVAEHHASHGLAGCSPEVLLGRLGAETRSMRIGSGGVMLPHYSPYKVAENFKLLETLYPGRIDLGVGRAPGTTPFISSALAYGSPYAGAEYFPQKVADLEALLRDAPPVTSGLEKARAMPEVTTAPVLWMLGSSEDSAYLAARSGLPYSFAFFINPEMGDHIFRIYRDNFRPSAVLEKPYACLTVFTICADTEEQAKRLGLSRNLWFLRLVSQHRDSGFPSVEEAEQYPYSQQDLAYLRSRHRNELIGTPEQVKEGLEQIAHRFGADELMLVTITYDFAARLHSYELIAQAWGNEKKS